MLVPTLARVVVVRTRGATGVVEVDRLARGAGHGPPEKPKVEARRLWVCQLSISWSFYNGRSIFRPTIVFLIDWASQFRNYPIFFVFTVVSDTNLGHGISHRASCASFLNANFWMRCRALQSM